MDENDGRLTRRRAFGVAGTAGAAVVLARAAGPLDLLGSSAAPASARAATTCTLTPSKTEGPYFVDEKLNRSDIRADPTNGTTQDGVPLSLDFVVQRSDGDCAPVEGATVDVWHANAKGLYSDESANNTSGRKYLRGYQVTGSDGRASFTTIYPGWYSGRAIHIHFKIRLYDGSSQTYEFTSQLFFDPSTTKQVVQTSAYSSHGSPDTTNSSDNIYGSDGSQLVLSLSSDGNGGYAGTFVVGLSGLPGSTGTGSADSSVNASLAGSGWRRSASGKRLLKLTLTASETVTAGAKLTRSGHRFAHLSKKVRKGTHAVYVRVPLRTSAGPARLTLRLVDGSGNEKTVHRSVHVPKRLG